MKYYVFNFNDKIEKLAYKSDVRLGWWWLLGFVYKGRTRNIHSLFLLKNRVEHVSCVVYEGVCTCGESYIGETIQIESIRYPDTYCYFQ